MQIASGPAEALSEPHDGVAALERQRAECLVFLDRLCDSAELSQDNLEEATRELLSEVADWRAGVENRS